ncbi:E3 ubiquitin-protein ligase rnf213-alpha-like [Dreissena polymorpha]|uniref:E3 ubiquitin-protein ligase rnf213-alpha-like n=1 Tax=Dreissena polymorpha TaxID=45954 RepID=UPI0022654B8C|nr:E3 ubiquitin-protein ligase rnf213-alpha-like [Dreissena polymorpha]
MRMNLFCSHFCPEWFRVGTDALTETFKESFEKLDSLVFCLKRIYFQHTKCFDKEPDFKQQIGLVVLGPVIEDLYKRSSAQMKTKDIVMQSMAIAIACNSIQIDLSLQHWQYLCRCLLVSPNNQEKKCSDFEGVLTLATNENLRKALLNIVKMQPKSDKDPSWMFCLPLLHFVFGVCQPYDELGEDMSHASQAPKWWGIVDIKPEIDQFKNNTNKWNIPLDHVLKCLQPVFGLDPYLSRSIVAALTPIELYCLCDSDAIPIEVCLASLLFWSLASNPSYTQHNIVLELYDNNEKIVCDCLLLVINRLLKTVLTENESLVKWAIAFKLGVEGVEKMYRTNRIMKISCWSAIFLLCITTHRRLVESESAKGRVDKPDYDAHISAVAGNIASWLRLYSPLDITYKMATYLNYWNYAFVSFAGDTFNHWNSCLALELKQNLGNQFSGRRNVKEEFVAVFCTQLELFQKPLQECLTTLASEAIDEGHTVDYHKMNSEQKQRLKWLMTSMFHKFWRQYVLSDSPNASLQILKMAITWPPIKLFLKNKDEGSENQLLYDDARVNLDLIITMCNSCWASVETGDIEIGMLRMINEHVSGFSAIMNILLPKENAVLFSRTIQVRMIELEAFEAQSRQLSELVNHCQIIKVDTTDVDRILTITTNNLESQPLNRFCATVKMKSVQDVVEPKITAFKISKGVLDILGAFVKRKESFVFQRMWNATCNKNGQLCKTLSDVVDNIWSHVEKEWKEFGVKLETGNILFHEFNSMFNHFRDDEKRLVFEITTFGISEDIACNRIRQVHEHMQLQSCVSGAKALLKVQRKYNLRGDFEAIKNISEHIDHHFKMKDFDTRLMKTFQVLKGISEPQVRCLEVFLKCENLTSWLKESMKAAGQKELKVFVDLAMMSAGEEPMNIQKVRCLHSAVLGYSPLIFELNSNSDCDYSALIDKCKVVWKELDANPNLPKQLVDTDRELPWLKDIKKAHGSVEVTSLMQADAINNDGVYTVGLISGMESSNADIMKKDVIKLTVPEKEHKRQIRSYTFSQLQDLQSRLMLVAGKSTLDKKDVEVDVEMFTSVFDSVTRLGNVFRKLCLTGCVLFNSWKATFMCNTSRRVCVILAFGEGNDVPKLKGGVSNEEGLQNVIPDLAKFMEKCLEEWLQYIRTKRVEYFYLNYFTVDQLVILQRELVKVGSDKAPSNHIYPLLSAVKQDCTPADLVAALNLAKEEVDNRTMKEDVESSISTPKKESNEDNNAHVLDEKKIAFVNELVAAGIEESLALRSIDHIDVKDIESKDVTQALLWCMDEAETHQSTSPLKDDIDVSETREPPNTTQSFSGWNDSTSTMASIIKANLAKLHEHSAGVAELIQGLSELWKSFLGSISSNISDYLNLEYLGIVLKYLAEQEKIHRKLATSFIEGEPNLIICPTEDIPKVTLSVYMHDKEQPLPLSDEVLVCSSLTSKDEVDIFWRRAIFGAGGKIHCLVNADLLDYDVSAAAEQNLEEYILETKHKSDLKYRLFVICGLDNEYRSPFVSSLDKYVRQVQTVNPTLLREYVAEKLVVPKTRTQSASSIDFYRSSARIVKSSRAGVGKSLYVKRRAEALSIQFGQKLKNLDTKLVSIPLQEKNIDIHEVIQILLVHTPTPGIKTARIFHIDISHEVQEGIDFLLFNLLILNCLMDKNGYVWRRSIDDMCLIETMPIMKVTREKHEMQYAHPMFDILPDVICRSPEESFGVYSGEARIKPTDYKMTDQLFDEKQFRSLVFQRTFQYLQRLDTGRSMNDVNPGSPEGDPKLCLHVLLRRCGVKNPSWSELHHFVWFLNTQLVDFEQNAFVGTAAAEDLPGFATFVLRFLMQMSKDFSTRSLKISEESPGCAPLDDMNEEEEEDEDTVLNRLSLRRTWESSPHPYLFFNSDHFTFTFLGFFIQRATGNLIDQQTGMLLEQGIMAQNLYDGLVRNRAPLQENFDCLPRDQKILKLCNIMGIEFPHDPDSTYELTTDNVKKIMAIYMRFRCDIPVIVMGETGCGKTRLVKFMCALQSPPGVNVNNMILMKIHGGTTKDDIKRKVHTAEVIAKKNVEDYGRHMYTVLFFDEANTTEAIGIIKEIMCDRSICGEPLKLCENLKIIAACNPYRKHPEELIKKLEQAGLGYHVDADETTDRLGRVPMRRLVYRVQPLPQSLLPLVWDFGQLDTEVEKLYICQMVKRAVVEERLPNKPGLVEIVSSVLATSQKYMRDQKDECSFVSLRDAERVLLVMAWFYNQANDNRFLFDAMDAKIEENEENDDDEAIEVNRLDDLTRCLVLAIGVCYHACLKTRYAYRAAVAAEFKQPCPLPNGADQILQEIECCQEVFLDNVKLDDNIARNTALKENVFMMVVCIELRIPLFLVGKPGSSKSLAKTIVADEMQGNSARHPLFKHLKQVQMVSFQCSPLSTPDGIVGTFRQCAEFQKDKDPDTFVCAVVLDEVGLAEDSPRMPLKTLHPLLEDGCQGDETPERYKKVAFIGISNWALDPAKMNRGILVQREVPDLDELITSAKGICQTTEDVESFLDPFLEPLSRAYLEIFQRASDRMREFYGLRDFYSLMKMVYGSVANNKRKPTWLEILHAIKRNFGGLDLVDPEECFKQHLQTVIRCERNTDPKQDGPDCSAKGLIEACLFDSLKSQGESRYLLLLTDNYGALSMIQQQILSKRSEIRPITIFGSSFRSDQEYTQVCRNINKIKVCMETGNTVVLLNLENLYESLYDALNQYYVFFGGERYVDLGLGTHRVKCPVHKNFRLIVVAEKHTVYKKFPIPLINRLEKHFLAVNTILNDRQLILAKKLQGWAEAFAAEPDSFIHSHANRRQMQVGDIFIGFHEDTCSAIVMDVCEKHAGNIDSFSDEQVLEEAKKILLWCATPESIYRENKLYSTERENMKRHYNEDQVHVSAIGYLHHMIEAKQSPQLFTQITCHSKLLAANHEKEIINAISSLQRVEILSLSSFDTEQQFSNRVQQHFVLNRNQPSLLIIQCDSGDTNSDLIACGRYCVMDEFEKVRDVLESPSHIAIIVQLPRKAGGCFTGFQCGEWHSVHIDDLYPEDTNLPSINQIQDKAVSELFYKQSREEEHGEEMQTERDSENLYGESTRQAMGVDQEPNAEIEMHEGQIKNMLGLITKCVQPALAIVKNQEHFYERETKRVDIVLSFLRSTAETRADNEGFITGIIQWLGALLKEKENDVTWYLAKQWITRDAAAIDNINKNGTFRRSCYQTIVSKVKPVLAGIFALLDTNSNLDMVVCDVTWKRVFWLKCLNHKDFLQMKYSDLQSPKRKSELGEMIVPCTGFAGHQFKLRFPFSWLILETVETLFRDLLFEGDGTDRLERCTLGLRSCAAGDMISELQVVLCANQDLELRNSSNPTLHKVMEDYIHDFVQTVYNAERETELNIVCKMLMFKTLSICESHGATTDLISHIVSARFAFEELSCRLSYFRSVNHIWPDCSAKIEEIQQSNPDHIMFKEHEFTFATLCLLIDELNPSPKDLDDRSEQLKWLERVYRYRPVVETILQLRGEGALFGNHSFASVKRAKCMWSRVLVMKLFLENVCKKETKDNITIKHCRPLWVLLGDETDFKESRSFMAMEKFLKMCNKTAVKDSIGSEVRCSRCEELLQSAPISVPCTARHIICHTCCGEMKALLERKCPDCNEEFEDHWKPVVDENRKIGNEKLEKYQQQCNTFFLEAVTQLCFADEEPPSEEVLSKLLSYVTCTSKVGRRYTKNMNIFDTGVDPNPVFRSFLLQLMMKSRNEQYVSKYLSQYIEETNLGVDVSTREMIDMYLLIIHCWEDTQFHSLEQSGESKSLIVCHSLENAVRVMNNPAELTDLLSAIASTRCCLEVAAQCLVRCLSHGASIQTVSPDDRKIIQAAKLLCENTLTNWPKVYLVKLLCRRYGIDVYQRLSRSAVSIFKWLAIEGTEQQTEVCDRYIICGDAYTSIREAIARAVLGEDITKLEELLQGIHTRGEPVETYLQLAIHREITCSNVRQSARGPTHGLPKLNEYLAASNMIQDKDLTGMLVNNEMKPDFLKMGPGNDLTHQGLQCLLAHFHIVMSKLQAGSTLLDPLIMLINGNPIIQSMLLPTMPQDDLEDIQAALLANRGNDNPVFYRCPNGHPYLIGDCGRPNSVGNCPECRQQIGGTSHQALPGNVVNSRGDSTQTGHILGRAIRGGVMRPERELNPTYCTATRLFLHMAMYLGPAQQVNAVIKPDLEDNQVPGFLLDHISSNIHDLQRALGRSKDDVLLLMHIAINIMMRMRETRVSQSVARLSSKADRKAWEAEFSAQILHDVLVNVDALLRNWNNRLVTDQRLGADPLMCLIYETDSSQELEDANQLVNIPRMWRFRTPITIEHMCQTLKSKGQDGTRTKPPLVLQRFMNEDCFLQALRYIPNILRLQRALLQKYQKKLDKTEANSIKVKDLKKELAVGHETEGLINDFACAWEITRKTLEQYGCPTEFGRMYVPKEFCHQTIDDDTQIAVFLPSTSGPGLCSYVMLDFLFRKQNSFLDSYIMGSGRKDTRHPSIKPMAVTSAHLISYTHVHDLMPLVLANCHYSFEMGVGTKIEYDFAGMERQLIDRLLYSKSMIEFGRFLEIDQMIYRTEVTNQSVLMKLSERIPQTNLNGAVRTQICEELRRLPDVCRSLDNLDIAISFLKTTGGHPTAQLITFMVETLQIEDAMLSQKARQCCELQHARALWLLLSFQKSKFLIDYRQSTEEVFETLQHDMYTDLDAQLEASFLDYINNLTVDKLTNILEAMHEFLLLSVSIRQNDENEDYIDTSRYIFVDGLRAYVELSMLALDVATLEDFPHDILYKHGAKAWVLAYTTLTRKLGNRRRY